MNRGLGKSTPQDIKASLTEFTQIAGQQSISTKAKKSVAGFHLREMDLVGTCVTLRGVRMYAFLERIIHLALPRLRDFRGLPMKSFDGHGNYTFGLKEQCLFPEIDPETTENILGMDITFVTTAKTDSEGLRLLKRLGLPFE